MKWITLLLLSFATAAIPLVVHNSSTITFAGMAIVALLLFFSKPNKIAAILFILACIAGTASEAIAVQLGILSFPQPDLFGVPAWLTFTWGNTVLITLLARDYLS